MSSLLKSISMALFTTTATGVLTMQSSRCHSSEFGPDSENSVSTLTDGNALNKANLAEELLPPILTSTGYGGWGDSKGNSGSYKTTLDISKSLAGAKMVSSYTFDHQVVTFVVDIPLSLAISTVNQALSSCNTLSGVEFACESTAVPAALKIRDCVSLAVSEA